MTRGNLEHLAHEAFRRPVAHRDQASRAADALELCCDDFGAWGEHGSEHRENYVELGGGVGEIFGVSFDEFDFQVF